MHDWPRLGFDTPPLIFVRGEIVFHQGRPVDRMHYLASGRVKLIRHTHEGDSVILHVATAGEMIAEASLFSDHYHCTAITDQVSDIHTCQRSTVVQNILNDPQSSQRVLETFSHQIRGLRSLIEIRNIRAAQSRIRTFLHSIADVDGRIELHSSLRDIAYKLGLAHETLYRELRILEENGELDRSDPGIIRLRR